MAWAAAANGVAGPAVAGGAGRRVRVGADRDPGGERGRPLGDGLAVVVGEADDRRHGRADAGVAGRRRAAALAPHAAGPAARRRPTAATARASREASSTTTISRSAAVCRVQGGQADREPVGSVAGGHDHRRCRPSSRQLPEHATTRRGRRRGAQGEPGPDRARQQEQGRERRGRRARASAAVVAPAAPQPGTVARHTATNTAAPASPAYRAASGRSRSALACTASAFTGARTTIAIAGTNAAAASA